METKELKIRITFTEEVLGTASNNPEIHSEFIASKAPDALSRDEEVEAIGVEAVIEKGMTVFPRDLDGNPIFWDYQIKGFFKDSACALRKVSGSKCSKVKAYKKATTSSGRATTLGKGQLVIVYQVKGNWAYIKTLGGKGGYVKTSALKKAG